VADRSVFAASSRAELAEAIIEGPPYQLDNADGPVAELMGELRVIQTINTLSHCCAENRDHEREWNDCGKQIRYAKAGFVYSHLLLRSHKQHGNTIQTYMPVKSLRILRG
jgi:hypothetical protein